MRIISTFLVGILLLLTIPLGVAAADTTPLLFELDLSNYDEMSKTGLSNTVNPSTAFSVNGNLKLVVGDINWLIR